MSDHIHISLRSSASPLLLLTPKEVGSGGARGTSSSGTLVKAYLFAYNVLSAAGWMLVFYRTLAHLSTSESASSSSSSSLLAFLKKSRSFPPVWVPSIVPPHLVPFYQRACTTYDAVGSTTALVQSVAVLEVLHSRFRLVMSPLPTTAMQVTSRIFSVWFVAARFLSVRRFPFRKAGKRNTV